MPASKTHSERFLNPAEAWWSDLAAGVDRSAANLLQAENAGGRHQHSVYELFDEMQEKDGHLYSVLQTRLNGLLGLKRTIVPAVRGDERARRAAAFVQEALDRIPNLDDLIRALCDALAKGFAVVELGWDYDDEGRLVVSGWRNHRQEWFAFAPDGELRLLSPPFHLRNRVERGEEAQHVTLSGRQVLPVESVVTPPERRFLVLRFGAGPRNHYGRGLMQHAYWYYWFKKNAIKFWAIFNEKYGSPTAVATYHPGTTNEERQRLGEMLEALQTDTGVVIPESIELKFLEGGRGGEGRSFREFVDWCNDEMSKIVLGATLTSGEGRRSGSLALGRVHDLVRQDYIESDARRLEDCLNQTLIAWLVEENLGPDYPKPRLRIDADPPEDLAQRLEVDRQLLGLGVSLPQSYFHERYGRPAPTEDEPRLRYDDANFYQYHLQFGVLTVNEVRERLGLEPVPWGDRPTAKPDGNGAGGRGSLEDQSEFGGESGLI